jgi:outer membrane receptor protein involved in Fe transport
MAPPWGTAGSGRAPSRPRAPSAREPHGAERENVERATTLREMKTRPFRSRGPGALSCALMAFMATAAASSISPEQEPASTPERIAGRVVGTDGLPIAAALVEVIGAGASAASAVTGRDGAFALETTLPATLLVSRAGFAPASLLVAGRSTELRVELETVEVLAETLLVQGRWLGDRHSPNSISSAAFDPLEGATAPSTVREAVIRVAGVAENGQGGLFQNYSIRGTSRLRVLALVEGMRVVTERRAGASASFLDPQLVGGIDVLRGPASTYYGSGAMGGVIQLLPRTFEHWTAAVGYEAQGDEVFQSAGWGDGRWSAGVVRRDAGDAETPSGETLFSRYEQASGTLRRRYQGGESFAGALLLVASYGDEIGKANTEYPERTTIYPRERHGLARFALESARGWRAQAWIHPNDLATDVLADGRQRVDNSSFDLGALYEHRLPLPQRWREAADGRIGVDWVARRAVDAIETAYDALDRALGDQSRTLDDAREDEAAVFAVANWRRERMRFEAGARVTTLRQNNPGAAGLAGPGGQRLDEASSDTAPSGFVGVSYELTPKLRLLGNAGAAVRFASLSERFFVGTTGRGAVLGNPALSEETTLNADVSLRWYGERVYAGFTLYRNQFDDYIERIEIRPRLLTFVNLTEGTIEGLESDGYVDLAETSARVRTRLTWSAHRIEARADDGAPLADVPADRLRFGGEVVANPWRGALSLEWRSDKDDPGSGEKPIPEAWLLAASVEREIAGRWSLVLEGENLFDRTYFASADSDVPHAPGRSWGMMVRWVGR